MFVVFLREFIFEVMALRTGSGTDWILVELGFVFAGITSFMRSN
jgi:hypothetical protein